VLTIWALATVCFFLLRSLPGNPFATEQLLKPEIQEKMMAYYGLDRPLFQQYLTYMGNLLKGDMGYSFKYVNRPVIQIIKTTFPISADLGLRSLAIGYPLGLFLGTLAARRRGKAADYICVLIAVLGVSVPSFVVGSLMQWVFGIKMGVLPIAQWKGFSYSIMPTITLAITTVASLARTMRASMLEVSGQDYMKTAKAKGLSEKEIVWHHQIRNALIPIITGLGPAVASTLMGSFIVEQLFAIPGIGKYFTESVQSLDYTTVLGLTVFFGIFLVSANFIVDILYGIIDPRIRVAD
jgi:oligopeptide transport system permease protein